MANPKYAGDLEFIFGIAVVVALLVFGVYYFFSGDFAWGTSIVLGLIVGFIMTLLSGSY